MNRFTKKRKGEKTFSSLFLSLIICITGIVFLYEGTHSISSAASQSQMDSLISSIRRSAIHCYAVEGEYPESLDYLKEHYGISWDEDKYVVDYSVTGSNLMPSIMVFSRR